jgi:hypothetical protein
MATATGCMGKLLQYVLSGQISTAMLAARASDFNIVLAVIATATVVIARYCERVHN